MDGVKEKRSDASLFGLSSKERIKKKNLPSPSKFGRIVY